MKMFSMNLNITQVIIILLATNLTGKMEFNQSLRIMTVIMKIMNKEVIMTSPSVFRPLSLSHLHGDLNYFFQLYILAAPWLL